MDLISVIIPTHNRADLIGRAIESVLRQTYTCFEIIVVDDASTDSTKDVVATFHDKRIRYVKLSSNSGGSIARNTGIDQASGNLIAFLDDDDLWKESKLEEQLPLLNKYDAAATATQFFGASRLNMTGCFYDHESVRADDLRKRNVIGSTSSFMAKRAVLQLVRFDSSLKKSQDLDIYISILMKGCTIGFLNKPLVFINDDFDRARITTRVQDMSLDRLKDLTAICEKHRDFFGEWYYSYRKATCYLSYFLNRKNKFELLLFAIKETNILVVVVYIINKIYQNSMSASLRVFKKR